MYQVVIQFWMASGLWSFSQFFNPLFFLKISKMWKDLKSLSFLILSNRNQNYIKSDKKYITIKKCRKISCKKIVYVHFIAFSCFLLYFTCYKFEFISISSACAFYYFILFYVCLVENKLHNFIIIKSKKYRTNTHKAKNCAGVFLS